MNTNERKGWIDVARALSMVFIIFFHAGNHINNNGIASDSFYYILSVIINPIKVPLFFAVSGYLFSAKNDDFKYFFKRLAYSRLIPYIVYGSFMGVVATFADFYRLGLDTAKLSSLIWTNFIHPFVCGNLIWFIPCLMLMEVIFFCLLKISKKISVLYWC